MLNDTYSVLLKYCKVIVTTIVDSGWRNEKVAQGKLGLSQRNIVTRVIGWCFFILNSAPRLLADPPKYDFIMVAYSYDYQHPADYYLSFEVRNEQLTGKVAPGKESTTNYRQNASVLRYNSSKNSFEEIVFDLPDNLEFMGWVIEKDAGK